jgi:hypothetical protein
MKDIVILDITKNKETSTDKEYMKYRRTISLRNMTEIKGRL